ncbi:alpha-L-fucosidase-like [Littorina saxatilis]|uniref:alpha-L-fucosidase n=1 Tax=Littorina saxatilis TaxID=31220 RepID=A0AAN9GLM8_9CAEN
MQDRMKTYIAVLTIILCTCVQAHWQVVQQWAPTSPRYEPTWESLDQRPIPQWYQEAKFGIFLHWGLFSVPAVKAWLWYLWKGPNPELDIVQYMQNNYPPDWTYADFGPLFKAEFFDPFQWADIFNASGARYVVLTAKHHEGFCMWPSKYSWNWNSMDVGPNRDLVGDLASAIRAKTNLKFGLYHSLFEFFNPLYLADKKNNFTTQDFVSSKTMPELYELVNRYKPEVVWSDGNWEADSKYWNSTNFISWLYNDSPVKDTVVTNDRWGSDTNCKHGGYWTCHDKYNPGMIQKHTFEDATIMDKYGWSYRDQVQASDINTMDELTQLLAEVVSCGGNLLLNVGPTKEGRIAAIFEERLRQMGQWLGVNGEAIYATTPWIRANDTVTPGVWYTSKKSASGDTDVYAIVLDWPQNDTLTLGVPGIAAGTKVSMLGYSRPVSFTRNPQGQMVVNMPVIPFYQMPCDYAWALKLQGLANA